MACGLEILTTTPAARFACANQRGMAASVSIDLAGISEIHNPGVAFDIEIAECAGSNSPIPKRVLQRWQETLDNKARSPTSLEDIEAKLKEADSRRQVCMASSVFFSGRICACC